jgi:hypothetical protein
MLGHDWGDWITTTPVTETTDGSEKQTCSHDALHFKTRILYATGTEGLSYSSINGGTEYSVSSGDVESGAVFIPAYHRPDADSEYLPVTKINSWTFYDTTITSLTVSENIKTIGQDAFYMVETLASVTFKSESQLETIEEYAFRGCTSIESVTIPAGIKTLESSVFRECTNLSSVTLEGGGVQLETIGSMAFIDCGITTFTIPASVTAVGNAAFSGCDDLETLYVLGHADQASADAAWGERWRDYNLEDTTNIIYQGSR